MPPRDGAALRRERIQMTLDVIRKQPGIHIGKIQIRMALKTGLTEKRVAQYVKQLVRGGVVVVDKNGGFRLADKNE